MRNLFSLIDRFRKDERGNIAVIFLIALVPLLGFIGAAVDYSMVSRGRTAMQNALDTAALMVSRDAITNNWTAAQVTTAAQNYFNAMYNHPEITDVSVSAAYNTGKWHPDRGSQRVRVDGNEFHEDGRNSDDELQCEFDDLLGPIQTACRACFG